MTDTEALLAFIGARLDEANRLATAASGGGRWRYEPGESVGAWTLYDETWTIASLTVYDTVAYDYAARMPAFRSPGYVDPDANGRHIAHHDPQRVLDAVDADRQILRWHAGPHNCPGPNPWAWLEDGFCETLRIIAARWRDHPDYDPAWAPA